MTEKLYVVVNVRTGAVIAPKPREYSDVTKIAKELAQNRSLVVRLQEVDENGQVIVKAEGPKLNQRAIVASPEYLQAVKDIQAGRLNLEEAVPQAIDRLAVVTGFVPKPIWKVRNGVPVNAKEMAFVIAAASAI